MKNKELQKPYLIQRIKFRKDVKIEPDTTMSKFANFDYMGSAEFEFGEIPKSYCRIAERIKHYEFFDIPEIKEQGTNFILTMWMDAKKEKNVKQYKEYLQILSQNDYRNAFHLKESSYFNDNCIQTSSTNLTHNMRGQFDLWYDIENDLLWSFKSEILELPTVFKNTFKHMKEVAKSFDEWDEIKYN